MNYNTESYFSKLPSVDVQRSIFDHSHTYKTSFNVGEVIPIQVAEVLPGDTWTGNISVVARLQTLLTPVMDNAYVDISHWYCPNIILWDHWKEFCGENSESAWIPQTEYQIPSISSPSGGFAVGTLADYMGLPVGVEWSNTTALRPSALPFRAYAKIIDDWFRDENLTDPLYIPTGDANQTGTNGDNYINDVANGGRPFIAAKYHDYFTSALPAPQKGPSVPLYPIDSLKMPVKTAPLNTPYDLTYDTTRQGLYGVQSSPPSSVSFGIVAHKGSASSSYGEGDIHFQKAGYIDNPNEIQFVNLWTDPSGADIGVMTINELRLAFQLQRFYEKLTYGSRYAEILMNQFGVTSPDATLYRAEYLGGKRIPLSIHQVSNTAQSESDFLGDVGAMSVTGDTDFGYQKSFTQHGYIISLAVVRYDHSYSQGFDRMWLRRKFTDFYLPVFSNLGCQPIYKAELYATGSNMDSKAVFGYQEAWSEYRYARNMVTAEMRPGIPNTLASWHFSDYYSSEPSLSDGWIREDKTNVDRTLAVTSSVSNQVFCDFYFDNKVARPMPMYSIPGLIDHN